MTSSLVFRALEIKRSLGVRRAAGYLRRRGVTLQVALSLLVGATYRGELL